MINVTYATRELSYNFDGSPSAKKLAFKLKCITEAKQFSHRVVLIEQKRGLLIEICALTEGVRYLRYN